MARVPNAVQFVKGPASYTAREPIAAAVLIWLLLLGISAAKRAADGRSTMPTARDAATVAVATGVIVVAAAIAPRLVVLFLLVIAVVAAVRDANGISDLVDGGFSRLRSVVS